MLLCAKQPPAIRQWLVTRMTVAAACVCCGWLVRAGSLPPTGLSLCTHRGVPSRAIRKLLSGFAVFACWRKLLLWFMIWASIRDTFSKNCAHRNVSAMMCVMNGYPSACCGSCVRAKAGKRHGASCAIPRRLCEPWIVRTITGATALRQQLQKLLNFLSQATIGCLLATREVGMCRRSVIPMYGQTLFHKNIVSLTKPCPKIFGKSIRGLHPSWKNWLAHGRASNTHRSGGHVLFWPALRLFLPTILFLQWNTLHASIMAQAQPIPVLSRGCANSTSLCPGTCIRLLMWLPVPHGVWGSLHKARTAFSRGCKRRLWHQFLILRTKLHVFTGKIAQPMP